MYGHSFSALLVFGASVVAFVTSTDLCPDGWSYFDQSCFFLSKTRETWYNASEQCIKKGGHLARIDSEDKTNYITLRVKGSGKDELRYIDGNDELSEGNWKWSSSQTPLKFTNWHKSEPNGKTAENCMAKGLARYNYQWSDKACTTKLLYICEKYAEVLGNENNRSCVSARELLNELMKCKQGY